jgi:hypothetical protein
MFMGSTCCLLLGLGGGASGGDLSKQVKALGGASVVKVADAANASGVVCVEATVPEVVGPVVVPGTQIKCLYYQETIKTTEKKTRRGRKFRKRTSTSTDTERTSVYAASIRFGGVTLDPKAAKWDGLTQLHTSESGTSKGKVTSRYTGFPSDKPLTIVGTVSNGAFQADKYLLVSSKPTLSEVKKMLATRAAMGKSIGTAGLIMGGLGIVATVILALVLFLTGKKPDAAAA